MQNLTKHNNIYLSGGGDEHQSFPLDKFFFDNLPKKGKFLYIPIALRGNKLFPTASNWMDNVLKLHSRTDLVFTTAKTLEGYNINSLLDFDAIYIGGGNTWQLMSEINESCFNTLLIEYLGNNKKIYGGSAGAIILGKRINTHDDPNNIEYSVIDGVDIISGYSVACHYSAEQYGRFKNWSIRTKMPIICLYEETGLVVSNNKIICKGTKPCTVIAKDGKSIDYQPDEEFSI